MRSAEERGIASAQVDEFDSPTGKGVTGKVEGKPCLLGNAKFLTDSGSRPRSLDERPRRLRGDGATAMFIAVDGKLAGLFRDRRSDQGNRRRRR